MKNSIAVDQRFSVLLIVIIQDFIHKRIPLSLFLFFVSAKKRGADDRTGQVCDQRSGADIRQETIGHVDPVIAAGQDKHTGWRKRYPVFPADSFRQERNARFRMVSGKGIHAVNETAVWLLLPYSIYRKKSIPEG